MSIVVRICSAIASWFFVAVIRSEFVRGSGVTLAVAVGGVGLLDLEEDEELDEPGNPKENRLRSDELEVVHERGSPN
jgi:hypothetical protein